MQVDLLMRPELELKSPVLFAEKIFLGVRLFETAVFLATPETFRGLLLASKEVRTEFSRMSRS